MNTARPPRCINAIGLGDTEASNDVPLPTPQWGHSVWPPRRVDPPSLDHTASAALIGDASDSPWPYERLLDRTYIAGYDAGMSVCRLKWGVLGFVLALVCVAGFAL